jgi:hypothetical protein
LDIFIGSGVEAFKNIPHGLEADIPLTHQLMYLFHKELFWLLRKPLHHCGLDVFA